MDEVFIDDGRALTDAEQRAMNATLVIFFLTVQSSYAADVESPATLDTFDTVQFYQSESSGACRIKSYATDHDGHVWSIGKTVEDIVTLARSSSANRYGDVLGEDYVLSSTTGTEGLRKELVARGLSAHLEIS